MGSANLFVQYQASDFARKHAEVSADNTPTFSRIRFPEITKATAIALLSLSSTVLSANQPATQYDCVGTGIKVSYSTTSLTGQPLMTVRKGAQIFSAGGDEITIETTVLGTLVTIVKSAIPDVSSHTFTLIAPDVNVPDQNLTVNFLTEFFITNSKTTIGGPALVSGVVQNSIARSLYCSASAVNF